MKYVSEGRMIQVKVKKLHPHATFEKAHETDIGYDLTACSFEYKEDGLWMIGLGVSIQPEKGKYIEIVPRSSFSKKPFIFPHSVGVIDPAYRGETMFPVRYSGDIWWRDDVPYQHIYHANARASIDHYLMGQKIAQAIVRNIVEAEIEFVDSLDKTERGSGGFGSTDKK